jgi:hypothetical protein
MTPTAPLGLAVTLTLLFILPIRAHAQESAAPAAAPGQGPGAGGAAPQGPPATPARPPFSGSLDFGAAFAAGIQGQRSVQVAGELNRPFSDGGGFVANASYDFQKVTFPSEAPLSDRTSIAAGLFDQFLNANTVIIVRSMYLRDTQMLINSRFEQLFGYGLRLSNNDKGFELQLIPGVSVYNQDLGYPADEGWRQGFGFFEKLSVGINRTWSIGNSFRFRQNFGAPHKSIESAANLTGMITSAVGVQLNYQYNYESQVPPTYPNYLSILSAGLHFEF